MIGDGLYTESFVRARERCGGTAVMMKGMALGRRQRSMRAYV